MGDISNYIIIAMFLAIGVWVGIGFFRTRDKITIYDRMWNFSRILFLVCGILSVLSLITMHEPIDIVRAIVTFVVIILFIFTRDGIGEEGVSSFGRFYPYKSIVGYDFRENKKDFSAYFIVDDGKERKSGEYNVQVPFEKKDEERVRALLKDKIGRKYVRMKKS
ncbi:MAG: hypothetical protein J6D29_02595 [Solobacterium sp.]|nr:hypothetical protein [Solobacterium sp.]